MKAHIALFACCCVVLAGVPVHVSAQQESSNARGTQRRDESLNALNIERQNLIAKRDAELRELQKRREFQQNTCRQMNNTRDCYKLVDDYYNTQQEYIREKYGQRLVQINAQVSSLQRELGQSSQFGTNRIIEGQRNNLANSVPKPSRQLTVPTRVHEGVGQYQWPDGIWRTTMPKPWK